MKIENSANMIDIYPIIVFTSFLKAHGTFSRTDHCKVTPLGEKKTLSTFKTFYVIQISLLDHSEKKVEIMNKNWIIYIYFRN